MCVYILKFSSMSAQSMAMFERNARML